jgi:hypothetical protein
MILITTIATKMNNKRALPPKGNRKDTSTPISKKSDTKKTPTKTFPNQTEIIMEEINHFGHDTWCAAGKKCRNSLRAANSDIKCMRCEQHVHDTCIESILIEGQSTTFCLSCTKEIYSDPNHPNNSFMEAKQEDSMTELIDSTNNISTIEECPESAERYGYGSDLWCGARKMCKNSNLKAEKEIRFKCLHCHYYTHPECFGTVKIENRVRSFCVWCVELVELEIELEGKRNEDNTDNMEEEITFTSSNPNPKTKGPNSNCPDTQLNESQQPSQDSIDGKDLQDTNLTTTEFQQMINELKNSDFLTINTRDGSVQALAIIANLNIDTKWLHYGNTLQYLKIHQDWFKRQEGTMFKLTHSNLKILGKIINSKIPSRQKTTKKQLKQTQQHLIDTFTNATTEEL